MSNSPLVTYTRIAKYHGGKRTHAIDTISIHCFGGQVTAKRGCDYFATIKKKASSNYVVGYDGSIGLSVEECNRSYCTSSSSNDNRAITIEVASDTKHPYAVTAKAYAALIDLLVDICRRNNIKQLLWKGDKKLIGKVDKQNMTVHRWFAAKACPGKYLYDRHGAIADEVNKRLAGEKAAEPAVPEKAAEVGSLTVDGIWGGATTTRLQQIFGTAVDGKVSNQWAKYQADNPGLASGWDWDKKPNGKGSQLIKALQKWAGMAAKDRDGEIGPATIRALQKKLGTTVDGKVSKPSQMVKALQKWANNQ